MATRGAIILLDKKKTVAFYVKNSFEVVQKLLETVDENELTELCERAKELNNEGRSPYTVYVEETDPEKIEEFYNMQIPDPYNFDAEYYAFIEKTDERENGTAYDVTISTSHFIGKFEELTLRTPLSSAT